MNNLEEIRKLLELFELLEVPPPHVQDEINFANGLPGYGRWAEEKQKIKEKMPGPVCRKLRKYLENPDPEHVQGTTFRYILMFLTTGEVVGRLSVACHDFGYTMDELQQLRADGATPQDVAQEIVSRE